MHLYLHVPFCARRCSYCDFAIAVRRSIPAEQYVAALRREWEVRRAHRAWSASPVVDSIYFGGGTPSLLPAEHLAGLIAAIAKDHPIAPGAEITLEANPEDVTSPAAAAWRATGINRLSLGLQSFNDAVLRWMHRTHDSVAGPRAVVAARRAGFDNISVDLIFGLPSQLQRDWLDDLSRAIALEPDHLSLYGLTTEAGTPLSRWTARGQVRPVDEEQYADEYVAAHCALTGAGFEHYEVSNAARPGRRARHNSAYWARAPYLGLGPSAHSAASGERWWNLREWSAYARAVEQGGDWVAGRESPGPNAVRLEELYLGLRTSEGVGAELVPGPTLARWTRTGWATTTDGRVRLTVDGWLRLDALVASV